MHDLGTENEKMSYIKQHWRGKLPLGISYWVNNVLLSVLILISMIILSDMVSSFSSYSFSFFGLILFYIFIFFVVSPWVYVGLLRSASNHIKQHNVYFWANIVRILVVVGIFRTVMTFVDSAYPQMVEYYKIAMGTDDLPSYIIQLEENNTTLKIIGGIKFGLTDDVNTYLEKYPQIDTLHLESIGGRVNEAMELAKVVEKKNLNTYVSDICFSACSYIFIAGDERMVEPTARLGFHQPSFPGLAQEELKSQIARDKRFFIKKGIEKDFVDKIFKVPSETILQVEYEELKKVGVATKLVEGKYVDIWSKSMDEIEILLSYRGLTKEVLSKGVAALLTQLRDEVRVGLPVMIDSMTREESIESGKDWVSYEYTILESFDENEHAIFEIGMNEAVKESVCTDLLSVYLLKKNVLIKHSYYVEPDHKFLFTVKIDSCEVVKNEEE